MSATNGRAQAAAWVDAGMRIARDLAAQAVWADDVCTFHGATPPESVHHPPRFHSVRGDLYEGSAGVARFLAMAAVMSGDDSLKATALGALGHAHRTIVGWPLFTGGTGVALVALELAEWLDRPDLVAPGVALLERASSTAATERAPCDLLVGSAGVVVGLVAARDYDLDGGWQRRAVDLGRTLLGVAVAEGPEGDDGPPLSWPLAPGSADRLCGLAHGASGVALAFEALAMAAAGRSSEVSMWRSAARRARTWERANYSSSEGSWADLRSPEAGMPAGPPGFPHMWCHGSIGIAAERLGAVEHDPLARADAVGGLAGARAHADRLLAGPVGPGANDAINGSLCHGVAGLIDLFVDAWQITADTSWMALAGTLADLMINDARRAGGWRSGVPGGWAAPGLMLGSAGIGWALLRVGEPDRMPSGWRVGSQLGKRRTGADDPARTRSI